ncbi:hypothetical protein FYK55_20400 [Roseiconus nitratireducens]|uniref:Uncharacterized protein n=1 Tax=Roseiconus nitratireducens TaxID=2605748 RepID=A0A5M6D121_9BACT|nr:hypothetical protein [Roseiconus nitratireducens]KAA5540746.1 hypothetical protein FYK55_20400 [Roseiconus nitratireducens]
MSRPCCVLGTAVVLMLTVGCEPQPELADLPAIASGTALVAADVNPQQLRWPVEADEWQVSPPSDYAFLRRMEKGEIGKVAEQIVREREERIAQADQSDDPPPWSVAHYDFPVEEVISVKAAVDEYSGELMKRLRVDIPDHIREPHVTFDPSEKYLVLADENLWFCQLPYREHWATPDTPPQPSDIAGSPDKFVQIPLPAAETDAPVHVEFFLDDARAVVAKGATVCVVDFGTQKILTKAELEGAVQHLSVAINTGDAILVDQQGNLYWSDKSLQRFVRVGKVPTDLPMPTLSPDGDRIVSYRNPEVGRVQMIGPGGPAHAFDVELANADQPLAIWCSRDVDLWIEPNRIYRRQNDRDGNENRRRADPITLYWELEQVFASHWFPSRRWQTCIASRPSADGKRQRVLFDANLDSRWPYRPVELPDLEGKTVVSATSGTTVAIHDHRHIDLYYRVSGLTDDVRNLTSLASKWVMARQFDDMERLHRLLRALPEDRFDRTPEQLYTSLIDGVSNGWWRTLKQSEYEDGEAEQREAARETLAAIEAWSAKESTLGLCCRIRLHLNTAWDARGTGWANSVSAQDWQVFEDENMKAAALLRTLLQRDDVPVYSYEAAIPVARDTGKTYESVAALLESGLRRHPREFAWHQGMMSWKLEKWGGSRDGSAIYAASIADALGAPEGDFLYAQCIQSIQFHFGFPFFDYCGVQENRILSGVRHGLETGYYRYSSAAHSMYLLHSSHGQRPAPPSTGAYGIKAIELTRRLADYYKQRYPLLTYDELRNQRFQELSSYLPN